jgi:hypothetical protein
VRWRKKPELSSAVDGLSATVGAELGVDVAQVRPNRVRRYEQLAGDLRRAQVGRQISDDTHLCCATSPTSASTASTMTIEAETDSFVII